MTPEPPTILIPRAAEEAASTAALFSARGFQTICAPLLQIDWLDDLPAIPPQAGGVIFTSKNGVRGWQAAAWSTALPCWCVGTATADLAAKAGFGEITTGTGTADDLADQLIACPPQALPLLHACEATAGAELADRLNASGITTIRQPVYRSDGVASLPQLVADAITSGRLSHVALFSPRMAQALVNSLCNASLHQNAACLTLLCLSPKVAAAANHPEITWANVLIASAPRLTTLIDLV